MQIKKNKLNDPKLSLILIDWNVRESFHIIEYLHNQNISREDYEIMWIEFYDNEPEEIAKYFEKGYIDTWIVAEQNLNTIYHKHFLYNLGFIYSSSEIVSILDSDALVSPNFCNEVISTLTKEPKLVLHFDQVRNDSKHHYPFDNPTVEELLNIEECRNLDSNGLTTGLNDKDDILHTRNYGACMAVQRKEVIAIGGADEHIDYLGFICGPYDLTFRLVNAGLTEQWHTKELLFHCWHPGTDGTLDYCGPHDGMNLSTVALETINSKRLFPLKENKIINKIRHKLPYNENDISAYLNSLTSNWQYEDLLKFREVGTWGKARRDFFFLKYKYLQSHKNLLNISLEGYIINLKSPDLFKKIIEHQLTQKEKYYFLQELFHFSKKQSLFSVLNKNKINKNKLKNLFYISILFYELGSLQECYCILKYLRQQQFYNHYIDEFIKTVNNFINSGIFSNYISKTSSEMIDYNDIMTALLFSLWQYDKNLLKRILATKDKNIVLGGMGRNGRNIYKYINDMKILQDKNLFYWDDSKESKFLKKMDPIKWKSWKQNTTIFLTPNNNLSMLNKLLNILKNDIENDNNIKTFVIAGIGKNGLQVLNFFKNNPFITNCSLKIWDDNKTSAEINKFGVEKFTINSNEDFNKVFIFLTPIIHEKMLKRLDTVNIPKKNIFNKIIWKTL